MPSLSVDPDYVIALLNNNPFNLASSSINATLKTCRWESIGDGLTELSAPTTPNSETYTPARFHCIARMESNRFRLLPDAGFMPTFKKGIETAKATAYLGEPIQPKYKPFWRPIPRVLTSIEALKPRPPGVERGFGLLETQLLKIRHLLYVPHVSCPLSTPLFCS